MKRKRRAAAPLRRGPAVLLGDGCLLLLVLAGTAFSFLTAFSVQIQPIQNALSIKFHYDIPQ